MGNERHSSFADEFQILFVDTPPLSQGWLEYNFPPFMLAARGDFLSNSAVYEGGNRVQ